MNLITRWMLYILSEGFTCFSLWDYIFIEGLYSTCLNLILILMICFDVIVYSDDLVLYGPLVLWLLNLTK